MHAAGYGFAVSSNKSMTGLVLCKGGGNHSKHGYVDDVPAAITAASNIAVQMYQYQGIGTLFTEKPLMHHAFPHLLCFDLIPSSSFLSVLGETPIRTEDDLSISQADLNLFHTLKARPIAISNAIKKFKKSKGNSDDTDVMDDEA
ncbi:hypothetical protein CPC08DRAFT_821803 [Agrocybe pediades]|nr:hypothetical protein CPC08DRAFT_821803 [Agrocybe pediades]